MANQGIKFSETLFFDGDGSGNSGFLTIQTSGQTGSTGLAVMRLTSCELNLTNNTIDLQSFDSAFQIARAITSQSFEATAEGYFVNSGATSNPYSGQTTYVTGSLDGEELLALAQQRRADLSLFIKLGKRVKKGAVVISSFSVSSSVNEVQTFSITLQSNGGLESVV